MCSSRECLSLNFSAALQNIPINLYEAAELDGAGKYKVFFSTDSVFDASWIATTEGAYNKFEQSFEFDMPAWGVVVFSYRPFTEKELFAMAEKKRKALIANLKEERKIVEKERDEIIAEAIRVATQKVNEIEKKLKELE